MNNGRTIRAANMTRTRSAFNYNNTVLLLARVPNTVCQNRGLHIDCIQSDKMYSIDRRNCLEALNSPTTIFLDIRQWYVRYCFRLLHCLGWSLNWGIYAQREYTNDITSSSTAL